MTEHVVLLDEAGQPLGLMDKAVVHTDRTPLHLAFSLLVFRPSGEFLLTRRALSKVAWPGVWTGACCGHPAEEESLLQAAQRRAAHEVGLCVADVDVVVPDFRYRAVDDSGIVENEICPVMCTVTSHEPRLDPTEVAACCWVDFAELTRCALTMPDLLSPWLVLQLREPLVQAWFAGRFPVPAGRARPGGGGAATG